MPDITMCDSDACPQSAKCYRYMAVPSQYRQSYAYFYRGPELKCDYFSAIRPGDIIRRHSVDQESNPSPEASPQQEVEERLRAALMAAIRSLSNSTQDGE